MKKPQRKLLKPAKSGLKAPRASSGEVIEMVPLVLGLRNILVPIDFSETSIKALHYAIPFAEQFGAKITLLYALELPAFLRDTGHVAFNEKDIAKRQKKRLADFAKRTIQPALLSKIVIQIGTPWDIVVSTARKLRSDLIITTTHGYTGFKHVFLGSTAERIVQHAPCPVLVVRDREKDFA